MNARAVARHHYMTGLAWLIWKGSGLALKGAVNFGAAVFIGGVWCIQAGERVKRLSRGGRSRSGLGTEASKATQREAA